MADTIETTEIDKIEKDGRAKNGGKREGSGRKAIEKLPGKFNARELFYKKIDDRWDMIMQVMDTWIGDKDKEAVKWMVEQRIGKAPTSVNLELSGTVALQQMEQDIKNLLYDGGENKEVRGENLQGGGRQATDTNGESGRDVQADNPSGAKEIVVECSHEVREILDGSPGSADESN